MKLKPKRIKYEIKQIDGKNLVDGNELGNRLINKVEYIYLDHHERYNFSIFHKFEDYKYDVIDLIIKLLSREKTYLPPEIRSLICDYLLYYTDDEFNIWKVNNNILPLEYNQNKNKNYIFLYI